MSMLAQGRQESLPVRRLTADSIIIYSLFAVSLILLAASGVTGLRHAGPPSPPPSASAPR